MPTQSIFRAMDQSLVNILMQTEQEVPDLLSDLKPEGYQVVSMMILMRKVRAYGRCGPTDYD